VRTLHTMPRTESPIEPGAPAPAASDTVFSTRLRRMMEKRSHD